MDSVPPQYKLVSIGEAVELISSMFDVSILTGMSTGIGISKEIHDIDLWPRSQASLVLGIGVVTPIGESDLNK